jgi:hypothetical protein
MTPAAAPKAGRLHDFNLPHSAASGGRERVLVHLAPADEELGGQPDVYWDKPFAKSDTFLGLDFTQAMGTDLSEKRMTEYRSFDASDTMNNLYASTGLKPKYLMPDDTYVQGPEDNLYSGYHPSHVSPPSRATRAGSIRRWSRQPQPVPPRFGGDGPDGGGHVCVAIRGDRNIGEPQGE